MDAGDSIGLRSNDWREIFEMSDNDLEFGPFDTQPPDVVPKKKRKGGRPRKVKEVVKAPTREQLHAELQAGYSTPPANSALDVVVQLVELLKPYPKAQRDQIVNAVTRLLV